MGKEKINFCISDIGIPDMVQCDIVIAIFDIQHLSLIQYRIDLISDLKFDMGKDIKYCPYHAEYCQK